MKSINSVLYRSLSVSLFAFAGAAWGQDAPPADTPPADAAPAVAPADPAAPEEETPEVSPLHEFVIGYNAWYVKSNFQKWRQYGDPPKGVGVRKLDLLFPQDGKSPYVHFSFNGDVGRDEESSGLMIFDQGRGKLRFNVSQHHSNDPTPVLVHRSTRQNYNFDLDYSLTHDIGVYWQTRQESNAKYIIPPADQIHTITKSFTAGLQGKVGPGNLGVEISDRRFYDRTLVQPKTVQHRLAAEYSLPIGDQGSIGADWSQTRIEQPSRLVGNLRTVGFNADYDLGPNSTVFVALRRDDIKLPAVSNATVRQRFSNSIRFVQRMPIGSLELGYQNRSSERMRADWSYVDVPTWDTYDGRLSGTFLRGLRYSIKGSYEHLRRQPGFLTEDDSRGLWWDDRIRVSAMISGGNERFNGYLSYQFKYDENSPRNIDIRTHALALGASYMFNENTTGYLEFLNETSEAKGLIDESGLNLDAFFPSWTSIALGCDHVWSPKDTTSLAISHYFANNANPVFEYGGNVNGTEITAQFHHLISPTESFHLLLAPWRYSDRVDPSARYRATVLSVNFAFKF